MELEDAANNNYGYYVNDNTPPPVPAGCTGHEHFALQLVDEVFHLTVDDIFTHLFTNSQLFQEFIQIRNTYDVNLGQWPDGPDENGIRTRVISYTLSINYSIGPKCSPSSETQRILPESKPGICYLIDADCYNGGVPYADDFFTTIRYCITKVGESKSRVHISGQVNYKKHIWGLIKTFIDKTASTGLATSFGVIVSLLKKEVERRKCDNRRSTNSSHKSVEHSQSQLPSSQRINSQHTNHVKERIPRHKPRKRLVVNASNSVYGDGLHMTRRKVNANCHKEDGLYSSTVDLLAKSVFIVVIFLVVINFALFYQITLLETTVSRAITKYNIN